MMAAWLSGNALVFINVVALSRAYWNGWPLAAILSWYFLISKPLRPTQPGHHTVGIGTMSIGSGLGHH